RVVYAMVVVNMPALMADDGFQLSGSKTLHYGRVDDDKRRIVLRGNRIGVDDGRVRIDINCRHADAQTAGAVLGHFLDFGELAGRDTKAVQVALLLDIGRILVRDGLEKRKGPGHGPQLFPENKIGSISVVRDAVHQMSGRGSHPVPDVTL